MNYIDFILIGIVLVGFILGYKDGLVRKIIGLLGLIVAIYIAISYSDTLGEYLSPMFNDENYLAKIISGIILFLATILAFAIIKRLIHPTDKVNKFLNQLLGGIAGAAQIVFLTSVFLLLLNIFSFPKKEDVEQLGIYREKERD